MYSMKKRSILILCLLAAMNWAYAQKADKKDLLKTWQLEKYRENSRYYGLKEKEQGDFLRFKEDMTIEINTEGETDNGTWMLNKNGKYVEVKYETGEKERIRVLHVTPETLVVEYDIAEYKGLELHYISAK